jgi:NAD(P)-dependent dehydrogenase (short-subunit alcohol dehydrogenase family)
MKLEGASCVVTGAARGIGLAISRALVERGARVLLSDVDAEALREAVRSLGDYAASCVGDVCSSVSLQAVAEAARAHGGPLRLWVNNAGMARHRPVVDYTEPEIDVMLAVNLKGTILGSQIALREMRAARSGHIVNVISTASLRGIPRESVYCAAKWGVRGFTQGLREEAAPHGIRVTGLLPGGVDTAFWAGAVDRAMPVQDFLSAQDVALALVGLVEMPDHVVPQELVVRSIRDQDFAHGGDE